MVHSAEGNRSVFESGVRKLLGIGCAAFFFWLASACQTSCGINNHQEAVRYVDGQTYTEGQFRVYESTPLNGEWLYFPGNRRFRLEHNLRTSNVSSLLMAVAFSSHPVSGDAGEFALATGDVAVVEKIDADSLQIRNDTCSEQYVYVKVTSPITAADAGATDSTP